MRKKEWLKIGVIGGMALLLLVQMAWAKSSVPRITKEELMQKLGKADVVVIDVRAAGHWESSKEKIKGAIREDPEVVKEWAKKYPPDRTLVFYCS
jgi:rhodanese-related sulfurtransferase